MFGPCLDLDHVWTMDGWMEKRVAHPSWGEGELPAASAAASCLTAVRPFFASALNVSMLSTSRDTTNTLH